MGRRSRRRSREQTEIEQRAAGGRRSSPTGDERPKAPWGKFPLSELVVLCALVTGTIGLITRGLTMIVLAAALGSAAGLELAIREHMAGYRSHTTLLAACVAVIVLTAIYLVLPGGHTLIIVVRFGLAGAAFAGAFYLLRTRFKRRSGGLSFR